MNANNLLLERILNLSTTDQMVKLADQVWDILQLSYSKVPGGFGTADTIEELIEKSHLWKVVTRNGAVTAVKVYKDQFGRKAIASGTNGTPQGKSDFMMLMGSDIVMDRAWAEVSGAPEHIFKKLGGKPIPAKFAELLTGKEILEFNDDGFHYTRIIGGHPHEKIIYGKVELSQTDLDYLNKRGITMHELPYSIRNRH